MINYIERDNADFERWQRQQDYNRMMDVFVHMAALCWFGMVSFASGIVFYFTFM